MLRASGGLGPGSSGLVQLRRQALPPIGRIAQLGVELARPIGCVVQLCTELLGLRIRGGTLAPSRGQLGLELLGALRRLRPAMLRVGELAGELSCPASGVIQPRG